ncbi:MAG: hypothetical protein N4A63_13485 [Vallitalea sp.]|jgi:hypothetical protein|nr:hypothetical protein [Vallitalea sp.]
MKKVIYTDKNYIHIPWKYAPIISALVGFALGSLGVMIAMLITKNLG